MITIVTIGLIIWAISAYRRKAAEQRRAEEIARLQAEMRRRKAEEAYLKKVQREQAQEQARLARESAKHEAMLLKHEEEIRKLKTQMKLARKDIEDERETLCGLYTLLDIAEQKQRDAHPGSKADEAAQRKVMALKKQISASEKRIIKAQDTIENAEHKLRAA